MKPWPRRLLGLAPWLLAALASLGVLALYQRPEFLIMLSEQIWACF